MNHFYRPPATAPGEPAFAEERRNGNAIAARMEIRLTTVRDLSMQALRRSKRPGDEILRGYAEDVIYAVERMLTDCKQLTGGPAHD